MRRLRRSIEFAPGLSPLATSVCARRRVLAKAKVQALIESRRCIRAGAFAPGYECVRAAGRSRIGENAENLRIHEIVTRAERSDHALRLTRQTT